MESKVKTYYDRNEWYNESGLLHRLDGPAIEYTNGDEFWFKNGLYHRLDGPAIKYASGYQEYRINGIQYFPLFLQFEKIIKKIEKYGK